MINLIVNKKQIVLFLLVLSLYSYSLVLPNIGFNFFLSYVVLILLFFILVIIKKSFLFNYNLMLCLIGFAFFQVLILSSNNIPIWYALKQMLVISLSVIIFYGAFRFLDWDLSTVFRLYLVFTYYSSILILIQHIAFFLGISFIYDLSWIFNSSLVVSSPEGMYRTGGFCQEPSHFAIVASPALYYSIITLFKKYSSVVSKNVRIVIILGYLLTFSSLGIIGLFVISVLYLIRRSLKMFLYGVVIVSCMGVLMYTTLPFFKMRVYDTFFYVSRIDQLQNTDNWSTYALLSNGYVAYRSISENPLFGSGLGAHAHSHETYLSEIITINDNELLRNLNKEDGNSMFIRVTSELGLVGLTLLLWLTIKFRINKDEDNLFVIINEGVFIQFILIFIRSGNYTLNGLVFFVFLYLISYKRSII